MSESSGGAPFRPPPGRNPSTDDLGFFASAPLSPPPTQPPAGQFGAAPPPTPQFGAAPPPTPQFGAAPPGFAPFGGPQPMYAPGPYQPAKGAGLPAWAIVAICVPVAFVVVGILAAIAIPVFLHQRSTPVAPTTLGGLAKSTDPQMNTAVTSIRAEIARRNQAVRSEVAGYGDLRTGYVLMSFGARVDIEGEFQDLGATTAPVTIGNEQCASNAVNHLTMCLRTSLRGGVEVAAFSPVDITQLAAVTDEAWKAQPFG